MGNHYAKLVPIKAKTPKHESFNRPSIEYTGHGNTLCYDTYGGRFFRASRDWVEDGCNRAIADHDEREEYVNYNTLYSYWGISESDFGYAWGWTPDKEYYEKISFEITYVDDLSNPICAKMGEPIIFIEPNRDTVPIDWYMEV